jgi:hypothetical protein
MYVELRADGTAAGLSIDVDGLPAGGPLVPEDRLQPDGASTSAQPTTATSGTTELPRRSAQARTVKFMVNDGTSVTDIEESGKQLLRRRRAGGTAWPQALWAGGPAR